MKESFASPWTNVTLDLKDSCAAILVLLSRIKKGFSFQTEHTPAPDLGSVPKRSREP